ncbi:MAG: hypothetical protein AABN95_07540 [Acidobacteriota bacterium]
MRPPISQRIVKPENCVIAFGIPTCAPAFQRHLTLKRDFASNYMLLQRYSLYVISVFDKLKPALLDLGVQIQTDVTLKQFGDLFDGKFDVVILFAHWLNDQVEFDDGFADVPKIVVEIKSGFNGLLDLCVCHPRNLVAALQVERQNLLIKSLYQERATPRLWLYFYVALFTYLRDHQATYLQALEVLTVEMHRKIRRVKGSDKFT